MRRRDSRHHPRLSVWRAVPRSARPLPPNETQRVSLCLPNTQVSSIVDDFLADAAQVNADALKHTPAEVALLGSVHLHHACT